MISLIKAYKKWDPAARNSWEIILLYPGVKAIFFHRLAHPLYKMKIPFLPRMISEFSRFITGIEIHPGAHLGHDIVFDHGMGIVIGETAIVGNHVLIYHGVTLGATKMFKGKRHPTVEDDVIIGAGSKVLGDIVVGKNAVIGANSVVLSNVPSNSTVAGIPAKVIPISSEAYKQWIIEYEI